MKNYRYDPGFSVASIFLLSCIDFFTFCEIGDKFFDEYGTISLFTFLVVLLFDDPNRLVLLSFPSDRVCTSDDTHLNVLLQLKKQQTKRKKAEKGALKFLTFLSASPPWAHKETHSVSECIILNKKHARGAPEVTLAGYLIHPFPLKYLQYTNTSNPSSCAVPKIYTLHFNHICLADIVHH